MPSSALRPSGSRTLLAAMLFAMAFSLMAGTAFAKKTPQVMIVTQTSHPAPPPNTHYFESIQAAVNATAKGDWVLIEPGTYHEEVVVTHAHSGIYIRGMDRNTVVLDGEHKVPGPQGANGIEVLKADNVWIENLTVRDYDRASPDGSGGNEIWWNGGAESEKIGAHGWWGKYLTAYDTGLNGGYGIFTNNEKEGAWENVYASGFNDSGLYIGACWECKARVNKATIEANAVGYSGSNSGGTLVIEKSVFRNNSAGIVPNSENPGDGPPPQDGKCNAHRPVHPTPHFSSTNIERCTIFKENLVEDNNNLEAPANESTAAAPWGVGIELPGDYADLVEKNTIKNNVNNGVLGFEYPNPFPPTIDTIYFQLAGNRISDNTFEGNGTSGLELAGDVTLQGGIFSSGKSQSTMNCVSGNSFTAATHPAEIEGTWGCQNNTTPPPNNGFGSIEYLLALQTESQERIAVSQEAPGPQETMPDPCEGVPTNPLCP
jgi:Protein of unknown function (DUF1565)